MTNFEKEYKNGDIIYINKIEKENENDKLKEKTRNNPAQHEHAANKELERLFDLLSGKVEKVFDETVKLGQSNNKKINDSVNKQSFDWHSFLTGHSEQAHDKFQDMKDLYTNKTEMLQAESKKLLAEMFQMESYKSASLDYQQPADVELAYNALIKNSLPEFYNESDLESLYDDIKKKHAIYSNLDTALNVKNNVTDKVKKQVSELDQKAKSLIFNKLKGGH